jgi:hypothetical protein
MKNEVSIEEKVHMINNFIKNLSYGRYNIELSLIAENAVDSPNQNNIDSFTVQLLEIDDKIQALQSELTKLEGE